MVGTSKKTIAALSGCFILLIGSTCGAAGVLATHPNAYFDGTTTWSGSVHFDNGGDLVGDLDFAVFTAGQFNANFGGQGYAPGDDMVYAYQLFTTGDDAVSAEIVGLANPANTIGTFSIGDVDASATNLTATTAEWFFTPGVATGESSYGLAYSSPNKPMSGVSLTVDGGFSVLSFGVPTPGPDPIPEPASLALLVLGGAALVLVRVRRK